VEVPTAVVYLAIFGNVSGVIYRPAIPVNHLFDVVEINGIILDLFFTVFFQVFHLELHL
jgi:hypothetical protein